MSEKPSGPSVFIIALIILGVIFVVGCIAAFLLLPTILPKVK